MQLPPTWTLEPSHPQWPGALGDLEAPPAQLLVSGEFDAAPKVGIVGTRRADALANRFAHDLAQELAAHGVTIVSGGALGIDAAAHRGALVSGRTIAVLASGLAKPYPRSHGPLFEQIARQGALVFEDHPAQSKSRFLFRNRLIAALSDVVVVVQAPHKSGALSTAAYARAMKRQLFVVPVAPWDRRGGGNIALLDKGAALCTSATSVLDALGVTRPKRAKPKAKAKPEPESILSSEPRTLDALVQITGRSAAELHVELLRMILRGEAVETPEGWIAT